MKKMIFLIISALLILTSCMQGLEYPETMLVYELKRHSSDETEDALVDLTLWLQKGSADWTITT